MMLSKYRERSVQLNKNERKASLTRSSRSRLDISRKWENSPLYVLKNLAVDLWRKLKACIQARVYYFFLVTFHTFKFSEREDEISFATRSNSK